MPTKFDISPNSVVILCDLCDWWRAFRFDVEQADTCAIDHEANFHPGIQTAVIRRKARAAMRAMRARRAERPAMLSVRSET